MSKRKVTDDAASSATKRRQQSFKKEYTEEFRFIRMGKIETGAFCEICNSEFSIKSGGKNDIVRHIAGARHAERAKHSNVTATIKSFFAQSPTS
ncbi:hypothetical protein RRG08_005776 [Elysia crispata]|uniref:Uncharacterized protein n=1 Tax=Elysia crispata TaxID=231223 RepID=A0AAE1A057_9GAST|nr:hypothetical protein RRG08_005776 [Elysia crispata]